MIELNLEDFVSVGLWMGDVMTLHGHVIFLDEKKRLYTTYPDGVPIKIKFDGEVLDEVVRINLKKHPRVFESQLTPGAKNIDYSYLFQDGTVAARIQITREAGEDIWTFVVGDTVDNGLLRREINIMPPGIYQRVWDMNDELVYKSTYLFKNWMKNLNYMTKNDLPSNYYDNPDNVEIDNRAEYYGWNEAAEAADEVGATAGATAEVPSLAATGYGPPRNEPVNQPTMDIDERSQVVPQEDDLISDPDLSDLTRSVEDLRFR